MNWVHNSWFPLIPLMTDVKTFKAFNEQHKRGCMYVVFLCVYDDDNDNYDNYGGGDDVDRL